ncbi:MAG: hypothetical protein WBE86_13255 [Candidatus Acidiferrales bacterium]
MATGGLSWNSAANTRADAASCDKMAAIWGIQPGDEWLTTLRE